ncbi:MAG: D-3-phosphoglycerate dehydrogenase, partial [uncultured Thermomicrobiales bacterium]
AYPRHGRCHLRPLRQRDERSGDGAGARRRGRGSGDRPPGCPGGDRGRVDRGRRRGGRPAGQHARGGHPPSRGQPPPLQGDQPLRSRARQRRPRRGHRPRHRRDPLPRLLHGGGRRPRPLAHPGAEPPGRRARPRPAGRRLGPPRPRHGDDPARPGAAAAGVDAGDRRFWPDRAAGRGAGTPVRLNAPCRRPVRRAGHRRGGRCGAGAARRPGGAGRHRDDPLPADARDTGPLRGGPAAPDEADRNLGQHRPWPYRRPRRPRDRAPGRPSGRGRARRRLPGTAAAGVAALRVAQRDPDPARRLLLGAFGRVGPARDAHRGACRAPRPPPPHRRQPGGARESEPGI